MLDKVNEFELRVVSSPAVLADSTTVVSSVVDTANRLSLDFAVITGVLADADATFDIQMFEGNASDMSDEVACPAIHIIGTIEDFIFSDDGIVKSFGYRGIKRYVRVKIVPTGNTGSAPLAILAKLGKKKIGSV